MLHIEAIDGNEEECTCGLCMPQSMSCTCDACRLAKAEGWAAIGLWRAGDNQAEDDGPVDPRLEVSE